MRMRCNLLEVMPILLVQLNGSEGHPRSNLIEGGKCFDFHNSVLPISGFAIGCINGAALFFNYTSGWSLARVRGMKPSLLKSAGIGAVVTLAICIVYLLLGPMEPVLRTPTAAWAKILFWPGIQLGQAVWDHFHSPFPVCWIVGVATMTLAGALLGLVIGGLRKQGYRQGAK